VLGGVGLIQKRTLGPAELEVSVLGFGCMYLSSAYVAHGQGEGVKLIRALWNGSLSGISAPGSFLPQPSATNTSNSPRKERSPMTTDVLVVIGSGAIDQASPAARLSAS
jgi:hypothetical protein